MVALIAAALTFVAIGSIAMALAQSGNAVRAPIDRAWASETSGPPTRVVLRQRTSSGIPFVSWALRYRNVGKQVSDALLEAGWRVTAGEFVLLSLVSGSVLAFVAFALGPAPVVAPLAAVPGAALPWFVLRMALGRRRKGLHSQLVDTFMLIAGAMKAGSNMVQALESTSREIPEPMRGEIEITLDALRLGAGVEQAFANFADRVKSPDLHLVVMAIVIQRQVGGDLAGVLETTSETMRQRERIRGEISSLTAQGRFSGYILGAMPVAVLGIVTLLNPDYVEPLVTTTMGRVIVSVAGVMELIGFFVIRRIVSIEV